MRTAYVVFAHGSRLESANDAVRDVAERLRRDGAFETVDVAFLDCTPPDLATTIGDLARGGAERIVVLPYFLTLGRHAAEDLPRIAAEAASIYENVKVEVAAPLDGHPSLVQVLLERAREVDEKTVGG
jgi:sirohydrochlorin ferrochelatase